MLVRFNGVNCVKINRNIGIVKSRKKGNGIDGVGESGQKRIEVINKLFVSTKARQAQRGRRSAPSMTVLRGAIST